MMQEHTGDTTNETTQAAMRQMIDGFACTQMLYVAAKLGIADLLADGPKSIKTLTAATGTHAPLLFRVLRVLVSVGVFTQDTQHRFALTPLSTLLRTNVPGSLRAMVVCLGSP